MGLLLAEQLWAASHLVGGQLRATPDTETYTRDPLPANSDDVGRAFRLIHGIPLLSAGYRTMTAMVEGSWVHRGITNGRLPAHFCRREIMPRGVKAGSNHGIRRYGLRKPACSISGITSAIHCRISSW